MRGRGISRVRIDVQHLERFPTSSGMLASPMIPDPPPSPPPPQKTAVRGTAGRESSASEQEDTIRNLKHSNAEPKHQCAGTARRARPGGAHSPGYPSFSAATSPRKGVLRLAGFRQDGLKVVGTADVASREPGMPRSLGRFRVNTPGAGEKPVQGNRTGPERRPSWAGTGLEPQGPGQPSGAARTGQGGSLRLALPPCPVRAVRAPASISGPASTSAPAVCRKRGERAAGQTAENRA